MYAAAADWLPYAWCMLWGTYSDIIVYSHTLLVSHSHSLFCLLSYFKKKCRLTHEFTMLCVCVCVCVYRVSMCICLSVCAYVCVWIFLCVNVCVLDLLTQLTQIHDIWCPCQVTTNHPNDILTYCWCHVITCQVSCIVTGIQKVCNYCWGNILYDIKQQHGCCTSIF
jgi:hypothetical protein